jgi:hypothetical protein
MSERVTSSTEEAADRLAIRELVEAYAHCADRREAKGQMSLFTPDTHFVVYMNAKDPKPSQELSSRNALAPFFADRAVLARSEPCWFPRVKWATIYRQPSAGATVVRIASMTCAL